MILYHAFSDPNVVNRAMYTRKDMTKEQQEHFNHTIADNNHTLKDLQQLAMTYFQPSHVRQHPSYPSRLQYSQIFLEEYNRSFSTSFHSQTTHTQETKAPEDADTKTPAIQTQNRSKKTTAPPASPSTIALMEPSPWNSPNVSQTNKVTQPDISDDIQMTDSELAIQQRDTMEAELGEENNHFDMETAELRTISDDLKSIINQQTRDIENLDQQTHQLTHTLRMTQHNLQRQQKEMYTSQEDFIRRLGDQQITKMERKMKQQIKRHVEEQVAQFETQLDLKRNEHYEELEARERTQFDHYSLKLQDESEAIKVQYEKEMRATPNTGVRKPDLTSTKNEIREYFEELKKSFNEQVQQTISDGIKALDAVANQNMFHMDGSDTTSPKPAPDEISHNLAQKICEMVKQQVEDALQSEHTNRENRLKNNIQDSINTSLKEHNIINLLQHRLTTLERKMEPPYQPSSRHEEYCRSVNEDFEETPNDDDNIVPTPPRKPHRFAAAYAKMPTPSTHKRHQQYEPSESPSPAASPTSQDQQRMATDMVRKGVIDFKKAQLPHIPHKQPIQPRTMENFYNAMANAMSLANLPFVPLGALRRIGSTCPTTHAFSDEQYDMVSGAIYLRLMELLPETSSTIADIMMFYGHAQDGYTALHRIMCQHCPNLREILPTWGPKWGAQQTAYAYASELKSRLDHDAINNRKFTRREIAAEILQQGQHVDKYAEISNYMLTKLLSIDDDKLLGNEFEMDQLIAKVEHEATRGTKKSDSSGHPPYTINKVNSNKFQYRRTVQCRVCQNFGHDTDEDICRIAAQTYHCQRYMKDHPDEMKANATKYKLSNSAVVVKRVQINHETEDECAREREMIATEWYEADRQQQE